MGWIKTIQAKIIGFFYPINIKSLENCGWVKVYDKTGPFGEFFSYKKWQGNMDGVTGHRFILYPENHNWDNQSNWNLIDFSKDITHKVDNLKQLKSIIPNPYI